MSLKENISMVKEELNTEEQFFEQAVKTERFVKKYKKPLLGAVVGFGLVVLAAVAYDAYVAQKKAAANSAFLQLQADPADEKARQTLSAEAPLLYDAWQLSQAVKNGNVETLKSLASSPAQEIADISSYEAAALQKEGTALGSYAYGQDAIYRDLALIDEAVLLLKAEKSAEAHQRLKMIDNTSPVFPLATALMHYGVQ